MRRCCHLRIFVQGRSTVATGNGRHYSNHYPATFPHDHLCPGLTLARAARLRLLGFLFAQGQAKTLAEVTRTCTATCTLQLRVASSSQLALAENRHRHHVRDIVLVTWRHNSTTHLLTVPPVGHVGFCKFEEVGKLVQGNLSGKIC